MLEGNTWAGSSGTPRSSRLAALPQQPKKLLGAGGTLQKIHHRWSWGAGAGTCQGRDSPGHNNTSQTNK